ncbi:unnamed protein product [Rangifer tarandus platyrhynchus]|uniref:Uncharacterized protein n=1 Tax=Rangifer tarandus platyrhynchus TaxID=3082113 RepID=A0ACB1KHH8_RANTA
MESPPTPRLPLARCNGVCSALGPRGEKAERPRLQDAEQRREQERGSSGQSSPPPPKKGQPPRPLPGPRRLLFTGREAVTSNGTTAWPLDGGRLAGAFGTEQRSPFALQEEVLPDRHAAAPDKRTEPPNLTVPGGKQNQPSWPPSLETLQPAWQTVTRGFRQHNLLPGLQTPG